MAKDLRSDRTKLLQKLYAETSCSEMSPDDLVKRLLEALEAESVYELVARIEQMSIDLDKLVDMTTHLDEIKYFTDKLRDIIPQEAR